MNFINFFLKKHLIFTSIVVSFIISSIIWLSIGWVSYFSGREQEISIETDIIFDIVTDIIKHDKQLVKENILPLNDTNDSDFDFANNFLTNVNRNNILLNNPLFLNNFINLYSYEYANKRLKYFNNLYTKHWLEVRDSKNNILIQTKYKYNEIVPWDDKYYEEKKIKKMVFIEDSFYTYTYVYKYKPYWYIALIRSISLNTIPDIFENREFSWNKWVQDTFFNVGKWEQVFNFWIIFIILMFIVPFALKNLYELYRSLSILRYKNLRYTVRLKKITKQFEEQKKQIAQQENLSEEDILKKEKELEEKFERQILLLKSEHNRQITSVKSGFSKYYEHTEKENERYKTIIKQQLSEIKDLQYKLQEHNIKYDPYKFTDFKFRDKADILILGGEGSISLKEAYSILKELGLSHNTDIKWIAYRDMDHFDITALQNTRNYSDIIVGSVPHSILNVPEQNLVVHLQNNASVYPKFQILRKIDDGDLQQITKTNLREALKKSDKYKLLMETQKLNLYSNQ